MKKILLIIGWCVFSLAFADNVTYETTYETSNPSDVIYGSYPETIYNQKVNSVYSKKEFTPHSGFFFEAQAGFGYAYFSREERIGDYEKVEVSGLLPNFNFKFGALIRSRFSVYSTIDLEAGSGESNILEDLDVSMFRFALGAGATFYLFPNPEHVAHGIFIGTAIKVVGYDTENGISGQFDVNGFGMGLGLEFGKTWNVSSRWDIGCVLKLDFDTLFEDDADSDDGYSYYIETYEEYFSFRIGIAFVVSRL